jgi:hypothetical protein
MIDNLSCLLGSCNQHLLAKSLDKILMFSYALDFSVNGHGHFENCQIIPKNMVPALGKYEEPLRMNT